MNLRTTGRSCRFLAILSFVAMAATAVAFDGPIVSEEEEPGFLYRKQSGPGEIVAVAALLEDFEDEIITEADLLNELEEQNPDLTARLLTKYNGAATPCMFNEFLIARSNSVLRVQQNGSLVFFEVEEFLDLYGAVLPGQQTAYNNARRANQILNTAVNAWTNSCLGPPENNRCCKCPVQCNCNTVMQGGKCETDSFNNCVHGSTMCSD